MARTAARWAVALVALLATTAAFVVRPVRCAQPVENHGRLSFGGFLHAKASLLIRCYPTPYGSTQGQA